jgi:hypothetical protein
MNTNAIRLGFYGVAQTYLEVLEKEVREGLEKADRRGRGVKGWKVDETDTDAYLIETGTGTFWLSGAYGWDAEAVRALRPLLDEHLRVSQAFAEVENAIDTATGDVRRQVRKPAIRLEEPQA